jgi:hypothetical protein
MGCTIVLNGGVGLHVKTGEVWCASLCWSPVVTLLMYRPDYIPTSKEMHIIDRTLDLAVPGKTYSRCWRTRRKLQLLTHQYILPIHTICQWQYGSCWSLRYPRYSNVDSSDLKSGIKQANIFLRIQPRWLWIWCTRCLYPIGIPTILSAITSRNPMQTKLGDLLAVRCHVWCR